MAELRLIALHYHLFPGGVTSVLRDGLSALAQFGRWERIRVKILVGSEENTGDLCRKLNSEYSGRLSVSVEVWPQLSYRYTPFSGREVFEGAAGDLQHRLEKSIREFKADAFWTHNATLGKNPAVTEALFRLVHNNPDLRVLYHLHDLAECSRYGNLENLHHCCGSGGGVTRLYPHSPNLTIITLTESDRQRLLAAGYPEEDVRVLPDPVVRSSQAEPFDPSQRRYFEQVLSEWSRRQGFSFQPNSKWLLAPIRTIRRKNTLEMALLQRLLGPEWNLLITLGSNSEPERPYADAVAECLQRESVQATLGFGKVLIGRRFPFDRLYASAEAVTTTSVLEGFGLMFAESALLGRPLIGRDLPDVTREMPGLPRRGLYEDLKVPVSRAERRALLEQYRQKINRRGEPLGVSKDVCERAISEMESIFKETTVDFSFLDLSAQCRAIHRSSDPAFLRDIRQASPEVSTILNSELGAPEKNEKQQLGEHLNLERFAERFQNILDSPPGSQPQKQKGVSRRLIEECFRPRFLRLILDTGDDWRIWEKEVTLCSAPPVPERASSDIKPCEGKVRAIFWDVYGTLLLPEVGDLEQRLQQKESPEPYIENLQSAGLDVSSLDKNPAEIFRSIVEEIHARCRAMGLTQPEVIIENMWQRLVERTLPGQWVTIDQARWMAIRFEMKTNPVAFRPEARKVIQALYDRGFRQGIISNAQIYTAPLLKKAMGEDLWSRAFDPALMVWSFEMGSAKPDPAPYARAQALLAKQGLSMHEALMIGDSEINDVGKPKEWGMKAVLVRQRDNNPDTDEEPQAPAELVCTDLRDVYRWLTGEEISEGGNS